MAPPNGRPQAGPFLLLTLLVLHCCRAHLLSDSTFGAQQSGLPQQVARSAGATASRRLRCQTPPDTATAAAPIRQPTIQQTPNRSNRQNLQDPQMTTRQTPKASAPKKTRTGWRCCSLRRGPPSAAGWRRTSGWLRRPRRRASPGWVLWVHARPGRGAGCCAAGLAVHACPYPGRAALPALGICLMGAACAGCSWRAHTPNPAHPPTHPPNPPPTPTHQLVPPFCCRAWM